MKVGGLWIAASALAPRTARAQMLVPVVADTPSAAVSPITLINHTGKSSAIGNTFTTDAVDMTGANCIVLAICYLRATPPTLSDSLSNSYTAAVAAAAGNISDVRIYYKENATVGSSMTFTATGLSYAAMCVCGFNLVKASSSIDQTNKTDAGAGGTTFQPGSVTPGENNEVLLAAIGYETASTVSINGSFTISDTQNFVTGNSFGCSLAYLIQTTAAAANPTFTFGTTQSGTPAEIATFKHS